MATFNDDPILLSAVPRTNFWVWEKVGGAGQEIFCIFKLGLTLCKAE